MESRKMENSAIIKENVRLTQENKRLMQEIDKVILEREKIRAELCDTELLLKRYRKDKLRGYDRRRKQNDIFCAFVEYAVVTVGVVALLAVIALAIRLFFFAFDCLFMWVCNLMI